MSNGNVGWMLSTLIILTLMLITASIFASPVLAVKKGSSSSSSSSVKTVHKPGKTTTTVAHSHIMGVKVLSVHTIPSKVPVGTTFSLGALVLNNSTATITFANGTCAPSPLSVTFDKNVVPASQSVAAASCKALKATLKPGERSPIMSPIISGMTYRATAPGMTNASIIFKYAVEIPTSKSPISDTYSRTYAFNIQPSSHQPAIPSTTASTTSTTPSRNLLH
jgi:hypothetical protein